MTSKHLPPPSTKAAERLAVIVDAAERAALKVIDDAEQEASRYLAEAKAKADLIVAERLREAADQLEGHAGNSSGPHLRQVELDLEPGRAPAPERVAVVEAEGEPEVAVEEVEPPVESPRPLDPLRDARRGSAAARLLATQMAVSGSSRTEIEMRLRNGFELEDTSEILDAILGPEG